MLLYTIPNPTHETGNRSGLCKEKNNEKISKTIKDDSKLGYG